MPDDRPRSDPDDAARGGSARYGHPSGSGSNEPRKGEKKDAHGFVSRQGGDQSRGHDRKSADDQERRRG